MSASSLYLFECASSFVESCGPIEDASLRKVQKERFIIQSDEMVSNQSATIYLINVLPPIDVSSFAGD